MVDGLFWASVCQKGRYLSMHRSLPPEASTGIF